MAQKQTIIAALYVADERYAADIKQSLGRFGIDVEEETHGAFSWDNILTNTDFAHTDVIVAELPQAGDLMHAAELLRGRAATGTFIVLLGRDSSVGFYHQLKRAGASEYFPLSTAPEDIAQAVSDSLVPRDEEKKAGKAIAVIGAGFGVGAGLTAATLALASAKTTPTVVVDGSITFPSVGGYLGSDAPGSLPVMLRSQDRLDSVLINQALLEPAKGVKLLDGFDPFGDEPRTTSVSKLMRELGESFPLQIWRASLESPFSRNLIAEADLVVPVVVGTMSSIRIAQTIAELLSRTKPAEKTAWVFNHRNPTDTVARELTEKHLGVHFAAEIPFEKRLAEALREPREWMKSNASEKPLAGILSGVEGAEGGKTAGSFWSRLWK